VQSYCDDYLNAIAAETTIAAAELFTAGVCVTGDVDAAQNNGVAPGVDPIRAGVRY